VKKKADAKKQTHLLSIKFGRAWDKLSKRQKQKVLGSLCDSQADTGTRMMAMDSRCEKKTWIEGRHICEQTTCYDRFGEPIYVGPILCKPAAV
jgi:hypothetical protein